MGVHLSEINRANVLGARGKVISGRALSVRVYEEEAGYQQVVLEGAIPLTPLQQRWPSLARKELIFFCA